MYAQKLEGDSWIGERMDTGKIDKMSGLCTLLLRFSLYSRMLTFHDINRSTVRAAL
jgi:hypothetical protein